jgi:hypothetical protein
MHVCRGQKHRQTQTQKHSDRHRHRNTQTDTDTDADTQTLSRSAHRDRKKKKKEALACTQTLTKAHRGDTGVSQITVSGRCGSWAWIAASKQAAHHTWSAAQGQLSSREIRPQVVANQACPHAHPQARRHAGTHLSVGRLDPVRVVRAIHDGLAAKLLPTQSQGLQQAGLLIEVSSASPRRCTLSRTRRCGNCLAARHPGRPSLPCVRWTLSRSKQPERKLSQRERKRE